MKTLVIGGSGKIGKIFRRKKNMISTYYKNKFNKSIYFNILKDDIDRILVKYRIDSVVILSSINDPDECYKNKKYKSIN